MAIRTAYGEIDRIPQAISDGIIPAGTVIFTKENGDQAELLFYDPQGRLKTVTGKSLNIQEYRYSGEFPNIGKPQCIYVATEENGGKGYIYRWSAADRKYYKPFDDFEDIKIISGGSAND